MDNSENSASSSLTQCPVCEEKFPGDKIITHVNKCLFLKTQEVPQFPIIRKRASSSPPEEPEKKKIPKIVSNSSSKFDFQVPLAVQMRPKSLDDFFGQDHVLGENSIIRTLLEKGDIPNMVLWGPPGSGKTSLAEIIRDICKKNSLMWKFVRLCAATCGVKEVENVLTLAKNDLKFKKRTVLFMDEIHRFNKKQQDVFLMSVEKGEIILIGATTENPSFILNNSLLSRCRVVVFDKLLPEDLYEIVENSIIMLKGGIICRITDKEKKNPKDFKFCIEKIAVEFLVVLSNGDARLALNNLELILKYSTCNEIIKFKEIQEKLMNSHLVYDKTGDEHYNLISAMHKSIRGSDANAALYWTTRMLKSGEDPKFIARRLVRAASEDIGNADPQALPLAIAAMQGCQLLGMPEADVLLSQCAIYLARAPKSREADSALARAKTLIEKHKGAQPTVPMHLRNAPTKLMQNLGYGKLINNDDNAGEEIRFMPPEYRGINFFE